MDLYFLYLSARLPNSCKLYLTIIASPLFSSIVTLFLCVHISQGGDFLSFLRHEGPSLTPKMLVKMTEDVASGMKFLESKKCIHRLANQ